MSDIEQAVLKLYEARKASREAKKKFVDLSNKIGEICDGCTNGDGPCYQYPDASDPSYTDYCEICTEKQPLWLARQSASEKAGGALRAVLAIGRILGGSQ